MKVRNHRRKKTWKKSGIYNSGYLIIYIYNYLNNNVTKNLEITNTLQYFYEYLFIYLLLTINFFIWFIYYKSLQNKKITSFIKLYIFMLIISLIGIPPLSGFIIKFNLFYCLLQNWNLEKLFFIIISIISRFIPFNYINFTVIYLFYF